jgi:hypothetical protein
MHLCYANARKPAKGKKHDVACRARNLLMDRWDLCEHSIRWWIKECYRSTLALPSHPLRSPALQSTQCGASVGDCVVGGARGVHRDL